MTLQERFNNLAFRLKDEGYSLVLEKVSDYWFASHIDGDVRIGFTDCENGGAYPEICGRIAIDGFFDKWWSVPCSLPLPETEAQMEYVLEQIKYWQTEEGVQISREYDHSKWVREYPVELVPKGAVVFEKKKG